MMIVRIMIMIIMMIIMMMIMMIITIILMIIITTIIMVMIKILIMIIILKKNNICNNHINFNSTGLYIKCVNTMQAVYVLLC